MTNSVKKSRTNLYLVGLLVLITLCFFTFTTYSTIWNFISMDKESNIVLIKISYTFIVIVFLSYIDLDKNNYSIRKLLTNFIFWLFLFIITVALFNKDIEILSFTSVLSQMIIIALNVIVWSVFIAEKAVVASKARNWNFKTYSIYIASIWTALGFLQLLLYYEQTNHNIRILENLESFHILLSLRFILLWLSLIFMIVYMIMDYDSNMFPNINNKEYSLNKIENPKNLQTLYNSFIDILNALLSIISPFIFLLKKITVFFTDVIRILFKRFFQRFAKLAVCIFLSSLAIPILFLITYFVIYKSIYFYDFLQINTFKGSFELFWPRLIKIMLVTFGLILIIPLANHFSSGNNNFKGLDFGKLEMPIIYFIIQTVLIGWSVFFLDEFNLGIMTVVTTCFILVLILIGIISSKSKANGE